MRAVEPEGTSRPARRRDPGSGTTVGDLRRLDKGPTPDRHPAVRWPDDRRPRAQFVEGPASPVAERLRRRLHGTVMPSMEGLGISQLWRGADPERPERPSRPPGLSRRMVPSAARASCDDAWYDDGFDDGEDEPDVTVPEHGSVPEPGAAVPASRRPARSPARAPQRRNGVEANARLTGSTAAVLFVLLGVEGLTILSIHSLLSVHVFVGMLLIPPVLLKIGSTTWRFAKYYLGDPEYRRKGPPAPLLRLIGPVVVVLTLLVLGSGVALVLLPVHMRPGMLLLHKASFVVWLLLMAVHVLAHLLDTARLAPRDWYDRTRRQVQGAGFRQWAIAASVAVGLLAGALTLPALGSWVLTGHG